MQTGSPLSSRRTPPVRDPGQAGITLVEVLVAVAILSMGAVMILSAYGMSASALASARDNLSVHLLLKEKMDEMIRTRGVSGGSGRLAGTEGDLEWTVLETPVQSSEGADLNRVLVTARRLPDGAQYSLVSYVRVARRE